MAPDRVSRTRSGRKDTVQTTLRVSPRRGSTNAIVVESSLFDAGLEILSGSSKKPIKQTKSNKRKHTVPADAEVVEISSDEEPLAPPPSAEVKRLTAQLHKVQKQLAQTKASAEKEKAKLAKEIAELKQCGGKTALDATELEDTVTCEICASTMWAPYITPNCGHSFCGTCLQEWFAKILSTHLQRHPAYSVATLHRLPAQLQLDVLHHPPDAIDIRRPQYGYLPDPQFTCPHCRTRISKPPTVNRALQTIGRLGAKAASENSPKKATRPVTQERLWGKFFPKHMFW
ncbi:hypothetical protein BDV98DRAFT_602173 [Pterulicium gracile]|uniref:RING-type domain-containing protein n=1 Tax=Pterulicium gracile TaxID=1884261 RepID=A0A5C3R1Y9_9AGAR|nr:hypothetical protein BDV98DRAFT_602173 [Pterula gracilis]